MTREQGASKDLPEKIRKWLCDDSSHALEADVAQVFRDAGFDEGVVAGVLQSEYYEDSGNGGEEKLREIDVVAIRRHTLPYSELLTFAIACECTRTGEKPWAILANHVLWRASHTLLNMPQKQVDIGWDTDFEEQLDSLGILRIPDVSGYALVECFDEKAGERDSGQKKSRPDLPYLKCQQAVNAACAISDQQGSNGPVWVMPVVVISDKLFVAQMDFKDRPVVEVESAALRWRRPHKQDGLSIVWVVTRSGIGKWAQQAHDDIDKFFALFQQADDQRIQRVAGDGLRKYLRQHGGLGKQEIVIPLNPGIEGMRSPGELGALLHAAQKQGILEIVSDSKEGYVVRPLA